MDDAAVWKPQNRGSAHFPGFASCDRMHRSGEWKKDEFCALVDGKNATRMSAPDSEIEFNKIRLRE